MKYKDIDQKALQITSKFKKSEAELLDIICQVDREKVYVKLGYNSLFQYCVQRLKLSESQTYGFTTVARKSIEVPEIRHSIQQGHLTISKAKRITSVITPENQDHWINLAAKSTQKKVEREVAIANPKAQNSERMAYTSPDEQSEKISICQNQPRVKMEITFSEKTMIKMRRAQDIISQKNRKSTNLENTMDVLLDEYLRKNDPLEKAKRQKIKGNLPSANTNSKNSENIHHGDLTESPKTKPSLRKVQTEEYENDHDQPKLEKVNNHNRTQISSRVNLKEENHKVTNTKNRERNTENGNGNGNGNGNSKPSKPRKRKALPASTKHQIYLQANGQCMAITNEGVRCTSKRFLEIHHIKPISCGGSDDLENLELLCSGHHKTRHFVK